jgi:hypothetical protein
MYECIYYCLFISLLSVILSSSYLQQGLALCLGIKAVERQCETFRTYQTKRSMKMAVVWNVAPCSLVEIDRRFRGAYCPHHQGDRPDDEGSEHL